MSLFTKEISSAKVITQSTDHLDDEHKQNDHLYQRQVQVTRPETADKWQVSSPIASDTELKQ